jgi:hypothetical protein
VGGWLKRKQRVAKDWGSGNREGKSPESHANLGCLGMMWDTPRGWGIAGSLGSEPTAEGGGAT